MKASALELRYKMKDILRGLERNEPVTITYRGKDRAIMLPIEQVGPKRVSASEHPAYGMWKDREDMKDVQAWVRKLRPGRAASHRGSLRRTT